MRRDKLELVDRIVAHASHAATHESRWSALISDMRTLFDARGAILFTPSSGHMGRTVSVSEGEIVEGLQPYFVQWAHRDAWNSAVVGTEVFRRAGEVRFGREFIADDKLRRTDFFNEWAKRYSAEQLVALKVSDGDDPHAPVMHMTLFRRFSDPAFSLEERSRLHRLWPALQRATQAHWILQRQQPAVQAIDATLDFSPMPMWVVRQDGRIDFSNKAALALMRATDWVATSNERLVSIGSLDAISVQRQILAGSVRMLDRPGGCTDVATAFVDGRLERAVVRALPITEAALYAANWPQACCIVMVDVRSSGGFDLEQDAALQKLFKLTTAQRRVLSCIQRGMAPSQIALELRVKIGTVRAHLHEVLSKTGCRNQAELVRLIA